MQVTEVSMEGKHKLTHPSHDLLTSGLCVRVKRPRISYKYRYFSRSPVDKSNILPGQWGKDTETEQENLGRALVSPEIIQRPTRHSIEASSNMPF